jgi:hypothetical protein
MGRRRNLVGGIGGTEVVGINGGDSCLNRGRRGGGGGEKSPAFIAITKRAPASTAFANSNSSTTTTTILGLCPSGHLNYHGRPRSQSGSRQTKHISRLSSPLQFPTLK